MWRPRISNPLACLLALSLWAVFLWGLPAVSRGDSPEQKEVNEVREVLGSRGSYPWYDRTEDRIRRIDVAPPVDETHRQSDWVPSGSSGNTRPVSWSFPWSQLFNGLAWALLVVLLVLLVAGLIRAFLKREAAESSGATQKRTRVSTDASRIESLPFQLDQPRGDLLEEARRQYEAGNYGRAIVYLFSFQLLQLDKHHFIRLTKGKTNRQYLRELPRRSPFVSILESTMVAFEDVFFGHHTLDRERFEACWRRIDEFQNLLQGAA